MRLWFQKYRENKEGLTYFEYYKICQAFHLLRYTERILGNFATEFKIAMKEIFDAYWEKIRNGEAPFDKSTFMFYEYIHIFCAKDLIPHDFSSRFQFFISSRMDQLSAPDVVRLIAILYKFENKYRPNQKIQLN